MQSMSTDYHAAVAVTAATKDEADQALAERLTHDEDYGFPYGLAYSTTTLAPLVSADQVYAAMNQLLLDTPDPSARAYNDGIRDMARLPLGKEKKAWTSLS